MVAVNNRIYQLIWSVQPDSIIKLPGKIKKLYNSQESEKYGMCLYKMIWSEDYPYIIISQAIAYVII